MTKEGEWALGPAFAARSLARSPALRPLARSPVRSVSPYFPPCSSVTFLGTGAACPTIDRNVAGLALQREGETILFDCGEGTQRQMMRYGVGFSFTEVFFTHFHADHMLGITGLLRTMGLQDRTAPVTLYGPRGAKRILNAALSLGIERNKFPVEIEEIQAGDRLQRARLRHRRLRDRAPGRHGGLRAGRAHRGSAGSIRSARASWACPKGRCGAGCTRARR